MSVHLQREIELLKKRLFSLCALVEEQVDAAIQALAHRDAELACEVERRDAEVDRREVELEEECLKTLALHQPVAVDLRLVVSVLKINNDLERIGDLAANIASKAASLAAEPVGGMPFDLGGMWQKTRDLLSDSLNALVNQDATLAHSVRDRDQEIDRMKHEIRRSAEQLMQTHPGRIPSVLKLLAVSRSLERIADHATNVAEDAIYLVEGRIVRHGVNG